MSLQARLSSLPPKLPADALAARQKQQPQSQPMLARHQSAPQDTYYNVYHPSTKAVPPSNPRRSSEMGTASAPTSRPVDAARAHLHYRDQQPQQFVTAQDAGYGDSEKQNLQEQDELARALEASQRETNEKSSKVGLAPMVSSNT
jgi:hypothetical protein